MQKNYQTLPGMLSTPVMRARVCEVKERDQKIPPTNSIMQCIYLYLPIHIKQINLIIKLIIKHRGKKQGI